MQGGSIFEAAEVLFYSLNLNYYKNVINASSPG